MESHSSQTTWLQKISDKFRFRPSVIGSDFQPIGTKWSFARIPLAGGHRKSFGYVTFNKQGSLSAIVAGGICSKTGEYLNDIFEIDCASSSTKVVTRNSAWSPRHNFGFVSSLDGRSIVILGGEDQGIRSDVWLSSDFGRSFIQQTPEAPWSGRTDFACILAEDYIIVAGGRIPGRAGPGKLLNDVWISSNLGKSWECATEAAEWKPLAYGSLNYSRGQFVLVGGLTDIGVSDQVWSSSDFGRSWTLVSIKSTPWKARRAVNSIVDRLSGEILIFGGINNEGSCMTDSWATRDGGQSWMPRDHVPNIPLSTPLSTACDLGEVILPGPSGGMHSVSNLTYIRRDCRTMLRIGKRMQEFFPEDIWLSHVIPFTVDTRTLSKRVRVPWAGMKDLN